MNRYHIALLTLMILTGTSISADKTKVQKVTFGETEYDFYEDVKYGKEERMVLDIWLAKSTKPTPVIVWYHGGSFIKGDKGCVRNGEFVQKCLENGISIASCNYPYLVNKNYMKCYRDGLQSYAFIYKNAKKWNIDRRKMAAAGFSAGCLISQHILTSTSKISAAGCYLQPMGTDHFVIPKIKRGIRPIFLYQSSPDSDAIHHPKYAKMVKARCKKAGVICDLYGSDKNSIEPKLDHQKNNFWSGGKEEMINFFKKVWSKKKWTTRSWYLAKKKAAAKKAAAEK